MFTSFLNVDWFIASIMILLGLLLLVVLFFVVDNYFGTKTCMECISVSREYIAAHNETYFMMVGKVLVPQTRHISAQYFIIFKWDNNEVSVPVSQELYNNMKLGTNRSICQHKGWITGIVTGYTL